MKTVALVVLAVVFSFVANPAYAQQPPIQFPKDGNGLLEYCGNLVNTLDTSSPELLPSDQVAAASGIINFKHGWCTGHLQAMSSMIVFSQNQLARAAAFTSGAKNPSSESVHEAITKTPGMTCIPNEVSVAQLARVVVKWLRDHPERLHEPPAVLTMAAFLDAFPCRADANTKKPNLH